MPQLLDELWVIRGHARPAGSTIQSNQPIRRLCALRVLCSSVSVSSSNSAPPQALIRPQLCPSEQSGNTWRCFIWWSGRHSHRLAQRYTSTVNSRRAELRRWVKQIKGGLGGGKAALRLWRHVCSRGFRVNLNVGMIAGQTSVKTYDRRETKLYLKAAY